MNKKEERKGKEEKEVKRLSTVRITEKPYRLLITLQGWRQQEEKRRVSFSEVLSDVLENEIKRMKVKKGSK